jgi:hypothetical protein
VNERTGGWDDLPKVITSAVDRESPLAHVLVSLVGVLTADPGCSLAIGGGLAQGRWDRYADIDLVAVFPPPTTREEGMARVRAAIAGQGAGRAQFPATHLGLAHLLVSFIEVERWIVKVDVAVHLTACPIGPDVVVVHDPAGAFRPVDAGDPGLPGVDDEVAEAVERFTGWVWYTYTRIRRGELFEAYNSLEVMRRVAYVPALLLSTGRSHEHLRRLESKLDDGERDRLLATYPPDLTAESLLTALLRLAAAFADLPTGAPGGDDALGRMLALIGEDRLT